MHYPQRSRRKQQRWVNDLELADFFTSYFTQMIWPFRVDDLAKVSYNTPHWVISKQTILQSSEDWLHKNIGDSVLCNRACHVKVCPPGWDTTDSNRRTLLTLRVHPQGSNKENNTSTSLLTTMHHVMPEKCPLKMLCYTSSLAWSSSVGLAANQWGPMISKPDDYSGLDHSDSSVKLH